ncbi:hypothetical protein ACJRO7_028898 [Eucalyptus globulus]|uniref:Elongator complex protein 6 n=1 Tax=Eucalyptus globulus TaxID=34317 RepID=A0ABD3JWS6_EUCGL
MDNLLDRALGLDGRGDRWPLLGKVVLVEDCVETGGAFVVHHIIKRFLSPQPAAASNHSLILVAFSQPLSHYDRVLRKLGCNLVAQRDNDRFLFFDMLNLRFPDRDDVKTGSSVLVSLFEKIYNAVRALSAEKNCITIVIDDIALMEVVANGSSDSVLDFLHYCRTLTSEFDCSVVALNHGDIYSTTEKPMLMLNLEYLSSILVRAEPLATGSAVDVHGQLMVFNKGEHDRQGTPGSKVHNFHFRVKENSVDFFYPGGRG